MKIESIEVEATIENTRKLLENDPGVSPALKSTIETLLILITVLIKQLGLKSPTGVSEIGPFKVLKSSNGGHLPLSIL